MHISGLEAEGRHPRALMESALLLLQQVIGLEGPAPDQVRKKPVCPVTPSLELVQSQGKLFPLRRRGGKAHREQVAPR